MHQHLAFGLFAFQRGDQFGQFLLGVRVGYGRAKLDIFNSEPGQRVSNL
jgi:hypothetical protein